MTRPARAVRASFAHVYDALYAGDAPFLAAQLDYLQDVFGPPPGPLLDIGCGTGTQMAALSRLGYTTVGVDSEPLMLGEARRKLPQAKLAVADMRRLPFAGGTFAGALCLESPLAYLMDDEDLSTALRGVRAALRPGGTLVIDVFDYPGTLGSRPPSGSQVAHFEKAEMRVAVTESHRYEKDHGLWIMRQAFEVDEGGETIRFEVVHRLRIREMDEYASALEAAGMSILQALTAYPNAPETSRHERPTIGQWRIILVARR